MPVADLLSMVDAAANKGQLSAAYKFLKGAFELARTHDEAAALADCEYYAGLLYERASHYDEAAAALGKSAEITRFKGLGEISPNEFKQFIGTNMRLSQVEYAPKPDVSTIFGFYMGKNTPERKDYIMANLVVPVEE